MRFLVGYVGSALFAAITAAVWVFVGWGGDQSIVRSLVLPDAVGAFSPSLVVTLRQLQALQGEADPAIRAVFDALAGLPLFLVLDLPALALFAAMNGTWKGEPAWDKLKPVWAALLFGVLAVIVMLGCRKYGLPPFGQLRVHFLGMALAAMVAGALVGIGRLLRDAAEADD